MLSRFIRLRILFLSLSPFYLYCFLSFSLISIWDLYRYSPETKYTLLCRQFDLTHTRKYNLVGKWNNLLKKDDRSLLHFSFASHRYSNLPSIIYNKKIMRLTTKFFLYSLTVRRWLNAWWGIFFYCRLSVGCNRTSRCGRVSLSFEFFSVCTLHYRCFPIDRYIK